MLRKARARHPLSLALLLSLACRVTAQTWSSNHADTHRRCWDHRWPLMSPHLRCQLYLLCRCWNCWHRILLTLASSMSLGDFNEIALFSFTGCLQPWNLGRRMLRVANTGQYWEFFLPSGSVLMSWNPICVLWLSLPLGWVSSQENSGLFWETILTRLSHPLLAVLKYVWVPSA